MKVDHWMDVMGDWTKYVMLTYGGAKSNFISETEWTEEELMAVGKRAIENAFPKVSMITNKTGNGIISKTLY